MLTGDGVDDAELAGADLVLAMTSAHRRELLRRAERLGVDADRIRMFRELDPAAGAERHWAGADARYELDVPDPWYGDYSDFEATRAIIEACTPAILEYAARSLNR